MVEFLKNIDGATAIEYGVIAALISVAIISIITFMGGDLASIYTYVGGLLKIQIGGELWVDLQRKNVD